MSERIHFRVIRSGPQTGEVTFTKAGDAERQELIEYYQGLLATTNSPVAQAQLVKLEAADGEDSASTERMATYDGRVSSSKDATDRPKTPVQEIEDIEPDAAYL